MLANTESNGKVRTVGNVRPTKLRAVQLLGFHRTHDIVSSGTFELPIGTGRRIRRPRASA
jgi:hypothetical protein